MAITLIKEPTTGKRFIYTKGTNPPLNIIISRINTYNKSNGSSILIDVSGEISHLKFANDTDRNTAMGIIDAEF